MIRGRGWGRVKGERIGEREHLNQGEEACKCIYTFYCIFIHNVKKC